MYIMYNIRKSKEKQCACITKLLKKRIVLNPHETHQNNVTGIRLKSTKTRSPKFALVHFDSYI